MTKTHEGFRSVHYDMLAAAGYFDGIEPEAIPHRDYLFFKMVQPLRLVGGVSAVQLSNGVWQFSGWFMSKDGQTRRSCAMEFDPEELESDHDRAMIVENIMDMIELDRDRES